MTDKDKTFSLYITKTVFHKYTCIFNIQSESFKLLTHPTWYSLLDLKIKRNYL